jgi:hypothetical protein
MLVESSRVESNRVMSRGISTIVGINYFSTVRTKRKATAVSKLLGGWRLVITYVLVINPLQTF